MSISIKTEEELRIMKEGGKILFEILNVLGAKTKPGIKTIELDTYAKELFKKYGVKSSFKGYHGYPASICTSVNEEIVHAIPGERIVNDGDIISIDAGVLHLGFHTDSAITVKVGNVRPEVEKFVATCEKALIKAIATARPNIYLREISLVIQNTVTDAGYSIIKELVGHGIGRHLHEDPEIPNFATFDKGPILKEGMTIAIEPIIAMGKGGIKEMENGWTLVTKDGSKAVQIEHTIAISKSGCVILTK